MTLSQLEETTAYLRNRGIQHPQVGIVLGTGLGKLAEAIENPLVIPYSQIPHFPVATVEFHSGKLLFGTLEGKKVIAMQGRFHSYEGYSPAAITYPIRVLHRLGIAQLLISNAAGAINLAFKKGDLLLIEDHINLQGGSPLAIKNIAQFGERFVDMGEPYHKTMRVHLAELAQEMEITLRKGVYAAVLGPQLETKAEYRYLKIIGADAVGMSTVPEVIVANQLRLPVAAVSVLTDECDPDNLKPIDIQDILAVAGKAEVQLTRLFREYIKNL